MRRLLSLSPAALSVALGCALAPALAAQVFVVADATGGNDGSSRSDAYVSLQSALDNAVGGDEFWIAEGVDAPTRRSDRSNPRSVTFLLTEGATLLGGFAGSETLAAQRDPGAHPTVLSGDRGTPDFANDNAYHVEASSCVKPTTRRREHRRRPRRGA